MTKVQITANYSTCCFCDKPDLLKGKPFNYEPIFQFAKHAKIYASDNNITNVVMNKSSSGKSASGILNHKCQHRDYQIVRIEWELVYN